MENPTVLSASSSGRRSSASNSPEFEFWMVRNPSCPETFLHSADELFSGGVLLPLQQLNTRNSDTTINPPTITTVADLNSGPISDSETTLVAPKRWKDMFKKNSVSKEKEKKKNERNGGTGMAELNINLWPFSRSRSAGNSGSRPRSPASNRKVSSAPCSRSNSAGESKSKKWPSSPNRGGVHVGRSSPVWQIKRVGSGRSLHDNLVRVAAEKGAFKKEKPESRRSKKTTAGAKAKVLNLKVQTCIGYRHHLSCRSDEIQEDKTVRVAGVEIRSSGILPGGEGPGGSNLSNLRNLFAKKVY
ncbi:uncharacterized protein LOC112523755 [Cynara cardunculus var. scolymus]|uniref:uncharacterized protein LOC112523755 n=1 Tax=Cynara cardunculus var. scolymus TaxID=59895 RepID=UPI000D631162|nr:uncharacterized protein LOC112523755 [Cynara cardunculus var. scolymus]